MRLITILSALLAIEACGVDWSIRWEAAKGESLRTIPYEPRALESILWSLPVGHPEANADIKEGLKPSRSSTELLGIFRGRKVIAAELEVPQGYYSRYFLVVAEVEAGKYMPIYIHQYAPGAHGHGKPTFESSESHFTVTVTSETVGSTPSQQVFQITCDLRSSPKTKPVKKKTPEVSL